MTTNDLSEALPFPGLGLSRNQKKEKKTKKIEQNGADKQKVLKWRRFKMVYQQRLKAATSCGASLSDARARDASQWRFLKNLRLMRPKVLAFKL